MDKEKNYYSLIESLVKNHRKFPGYEAILDDIVKDVYAHSEVIINSIDNESVIESYLEKVISTSIITVPKKMKFNSAVKPRVISNTPINNVEVNSPVISKNGDNQVVTNNINELDIVNDVEPKEEFPPAEEQIEGLEEITSDDILSESDNITEENGDDATDILSFSQNIGVEKADPNLVDKMINSIGNDSIAETINLTEETVLEDVESDAEDVKEVTDEDVLQVLDDTDSSSLSELDNLEVLSVEEEPQELELDFEAEDTASEVISVSVADTEDLETQSDDISSEESDVDELSDSSTDNEDSIDLADEETFIDDSESENDEVVLLPENDEQQTFDSADEGIEAELQLGFEDDDVIQIDDVQQEELSINEEDIAERTDDVQPEIISSDDDIVDLSTELSVNEPDSSLLLEEEATTDILSESSEEADTSEEILTENVDMDEKILDIDDSGIEVLSDDNELTEFSSEQYDFETESVVNIAETDDFTPVDSEDVLKFEESENDLIGEELNFADDTDGEIDESDSIIGANEEMGTLNEESESSEFEQDGGDTYNISLQPSLSRSEKEEHHYTPADYSVFDFTPADNVPDIDVNAITDKLLQLNQAYPNLNVLSVFEMKYKQNITISEIAEKLSMDKNQVIIVLNKIIELV